MMSLFVAILNYEADYLDAVLNNMGAINNMPVGGFSSGDNITGADPVNLNIDTSNSVRIVYLDDKPGNMRGEQ
mgnify:CR=1 FL=1